MCMAKHTGSNVALEEAIDAEQLAITSLMTVDREASLNQLNTG